MNLEQIETVCRPNPVLILTRLEDKISPVWFWLTLKTHNPTWAEHPKAPPSLYNKHDPKVSIGLRSLGLEQPKLAEFLTNALNALTSYEIGHSSPAL